jgi:hypothetical protein
MSNSDRKALKKYCTVSVYTIEAFSRTQFVVASYVAKILEEPLASFHSLLKKMHFNK